MRTKSPRLLCLLLLGTAPACFAEFRTGIAVRVVTPEALLAIGGRMGPARSATQKADEFTVRALVLSESGTTIAPISADFLGFPAVLGHRVRKKIHGIRPEIIGSARGICSPDLIGPLYGRRWEKGGGIDIFMNGAQGGMVTADNRRPDGHEARDEDERVRTGNLLADEALRLVQHAPEQPSPKITAHARALPFPGDSPEIRAVLASTSRQADTTDATKVITQFNLINLGNAQILTILREALPNIGFHRKRKMRGEHNLLFGLCSEAFGYILTRVDWRSFRAYDYVSRIWSGVQTREILIESALNLWRTGPSFKK